MQEKKQDARVRYTKMVVRDALISILKEKPIAKVTVTEICALAGINRATFYAHYSDPSDLLTSIEIELMDGASQFIRPAFSAVGSDLRKVLTSILDYIQANAEIFWVLLSESGDSSFQTKVVGIIETQFIVSFINERNITREEAEYLYTFAAIGSVGIIRKWLAEGMKKSTAEMAGLVVRLTGSWYSKNQ